MSKEKKEGDKSSLTLRPEFLPLLPKSTSIWGDLDILNSEESSKATLGRVKQLVGETGLSEGIYLGMKQMVSSKSYELPLRVFHANPDELSLPMDDWVTAVSGPLKYSEAIAAGYLLETAAIIRDILDEVLKVEGASPSLSFEEIARKIGGKKRFVPLGIFTIHDYVARMVHYCNIRDSLEDRKMSEDNDLDLAAIVGIGIVPLAKAFREDGYKIGDNFQQAIDTFYIGNTALFIPFAGAYEGHPKTNEDWQMLGLGLYTGVRLLRIIENEFSTSK